MRDEWYDAWVAALDELELDVAETEALLADDQLIRDQPLTDPWRPPPGLGPLPLELKPRVDAILERQLAASSALASAMTHNRQQLSVVDKVHDAQRPPHRPSYIDCAM
jgi:hypothetical protein